MKQLDKSNDSKLSGKLHMPRSKDTSKSQIEDSKLTRKSKEFLNQNLQSIKKKIQSNN